MTKWKPDLEALLREQMPFVFLKGVIKHDEEGTPVLGTERGVIDEDNFVDALGYLCDFVARQRKLQFIAGFKAGMEETRQIVESFNAQLRALPEIVFDGKANDHASEKAWLKHEEETK